jgi:hypothetical protein
MVEVAAEKNSTLVLPFPVEMLRYFEAMATGEPAPPRPDSSLPAEGPPRAGLRGVANPGTTEHP